jgi:hypothetical protein
MRGRGSVDWRRTARATVGLSLRGTGWLLTHAGRLLRSGGEFVHALGHRLNPARPNTRRE